MSLGEAVYLIVWWIGAIHVVAYVIAGVALITVVTIFYASRYVGISKDLMESLYRIIKDKHEKRVLKEPD